jgi:5-methylcytosine-specific restriction endonuclease McrA
MKNSTKDKYVNKLTSHIKNKIYNYRQQDILKKKLNDIEFVSFEETINLLKQCNMKCCYCSNEVYILYEHVREMKQWSLDRINNDIGHNSGNLVIACLECNLKRRRTNKDAFMFTRNMVIIKEGN